MASAPARRRPSTRSDISPFSLQRPSGCGRRGARGGDSGGLASGRQRVRRPFWLHFVELQFLSAHDVLVVLFLLDGIRLGFFHAVFIVPPAASWSRARHAEGQCQSPLRTRSQPYGVQAAPGSQARLQHENHWTSYVGSRNRQCGAKLVRIPLASISGGLRKEHCLGSVVVVVHARTSRSRGFS